MGSRKGKNKRNQQSGETSSSLEDGEQATLQMESEDTGDIDDKIKKRQQELAHLLEEKQRAALIRAETEEKRNTSQQRFSNKFATKKTVASGLLDMGLLMVNIAQLKLLMRLGPERLDYFWPNIVIIILSIFLQIVMGVILAVMGSTTVKTYDKKSKKQVNTLNNVTLGLTFVITTLNTIIAAVGVSENSHPIALGGAQNSQYAQLNRSFQTI